MNAQLPSTKALVPFVSVENMMRLIHHVGIETVTYVVEGRIDHYDNQGHEGTILPGDVQWMTAGRGLIHNEIPAEGVTVHSLQLWINLPAADKMTAPRYQDLAGDAVPVRRQPGVKIRVFSGASGGVTAPTKNVVPVTMVEVRLDQGTAVGHRSSQTVSNRQQPEPERPFVVLLDAYHPPQTTFGDP